MKNKFILAALLIMIVGLLAACGDNKKNETNATPTSSVVSLTSDDIYHPCGGEVKLGEYKGLTYKKASLDVTEEEIDLTVKQALEQYPNYKKDDLRDGSVVQNGDVLNIDFEGKLKNGVAFSGGTAKDQFLKIGSNTFVPGFESSLIGKTVGTTVDIDVTFPDPYTRNPDLSGQQTVFTVKINYVAKAAEEMDDDYVKEHFSEKTKATTVAEFRAFLKEQLADRKAKNAEDAKYSELVEKAIANSEFVSIEQTDLDYYYDLVMLPVRTYAQQSGQSEETIYKGLYNSQYGTYDEFIKRNREFAEYSVKRFMVLEAIVEKEGLTITDEEYKKQVEAFMAEENITDFNEFEARYGKDYLKYTILTNMAEDVIVNSAVAESE